MINNISLWIYLGLDDIMDLDYPLKEEEELDDRTDVNPPCNGRTRPGSQYSE